ncbi:MAG: tetratricopeptide repeat protein [Candidatus Gastranaerophilales bacterium]|nr:tetratricopeptide repeat protein [Candidatus Gastranaerophilales bacterium]
MQNTDVSDNSLEAAREAHERWLIKNNKKDLEQAIEYYSQTMVTNPNIPESYYRLAMLLWESGQISLDNALDKCQLALTVAPNNLDARLYAGYFFKIADNFKAAEKEFKKAININPIFSSRARLNLGLLNIEKFLKSKTQIKNFVKAVYYLSTGLFTSVFDVPCLRMGIQKCRENFEVGRYLFTGRLFKLFGCENIAVSTYKKAGRKTGRYEIFSKLIGDINISHEDAEQAVAEYNKALEVNPDDREALLKKATILQTYFKEKYSDAIDAYTKALETEGEKGYIYYELGHLYLQADELLNSISAFKLAVEEDKTNAFFHNALGYALFKAGQFEEAEDHYLVAINLNPEPEWTATVCKAAALIYSDVNHDIDKAVRMYKQSLSLVPDNAETYTCLGDLYFDDQDYDKALQNYAKAIELNKNDAYVFNKLATTLWQKDFTEEAIIAYKNAIDINPNYAAAYNNLGVVYLDSKNMIFEAKDCFETAMQQDANYTMAYFNAARVQEKLGDKIQAAKYYGKALELNQTSNEIQGIDIEEKIHSLFEV